MKFTKFIFISFMFYSCTQNIGAGTIGGWDSIVFTTSEEKLKKAIDSLYKIEPKYYKIKKWKDKAEYWVENYSYLRIVIFYFDGLPEEMYYVTFVDPGTGQNQNYSRLAIRGVENGEGHWKQYEEFSESEQNRIAQRFKREIITKLERITNTKSYIEKSYR